MKRCPQCQSVYEDAKNFCLNDGTPLVADSTAAPPAPPPPAAPQTSPFQPAQPTQSVGGWSQAGGWQSQQPGQLSQPPPQRKRRVWPWVVGVLGVVVLGGATLIGVLGYIGYKAVREAERQATAARNTAPGGATRRTDVLTYVNSPASFTGTLKEHYSDFSFQYPASWVLKEQQPGQSGSNFVKVERSLDGDTTLENFAVGWYTSTGTAKGDAALFPQLARQLSTQFAAGIPAYRKVSEGPTRIGSYDGYEFRFTGELRAAGRKVDVFGRTVMLPSGSTVQRNGVALIMLATSLAPEIKSVADVGVKGELPVVLESFRMGKDDAATSDDAPASGAASGDDPSEEIADAEKAAAAALSGVFGGGDGAGAPTDRAEVLEQLKGIEEEWARANNEGDKEALARILAEEYVGTDHTGTTERKAEYIRNLKPSTQVASPQEFEDLKVVVAGGRAVLTGVTAVEFKGGRTGRFRFVDTFVWRDGRWQAVTSTSSEIQ